MLFFIRRTKAKKEGKKKQQKTRKDKTPRKQGKETKNNKTRRLRETESEKGKVKESTETKKGRHSEMNKITRFQGKNSVFVKRQTTQNTKKGRRPTAPKKHVQLFIVFVPLVSSWSPIVFVYLVHCKSVTHLVFFLHFRCFVFFSSWWLCFGLLFPSSSLLCSLFLIMLFLFPAFSLSMTQKTRSNHRIFAMFILMFCFGACILALWLGPAKNPYSAQRTTPRNGS